MRVPTAPSDDTVNSRLTNDLEEYMYLNKAKGVMDLTRSEEAVHVLTGAATATAAAQQVPAAASQRRSDYTGPGRIGDGGVRGGGGTRDAPRALTLRCDTFLPVCTCTCTRAKFCLTVRRWQFVRTTDGFGIDGTVLGTGGTLPSARADCYVGTSWGRS